MLEKTAQEIADVLDGRLEGDPDAAVRGIGSIREAGEDDIAVLKDDAFRKAAAGSGASVLVVGAPVDGFRGAQVVVDDPERALADLLDIFYKDAFPLPEGVSEDARISPRARLGSDVSVGHCSVIGDGARIGDGCIIFPLAYIGRNVSIGEDTIVYPHASIMDSVTIGRACRIGPGAVIGDEGFGFIQRDGASRRLRHTGSVRIGDNVEVGGHSSIDRGMVEDTVVGDGCKIDKHCMIAHNCKIGRNCILAGYARMAGSVRIGDGAILAADVRIADHKTVGEKAVLAAGTGATRDIEPGEVVWGVPTRSMRAQTRIYALEGRLPELFKRVRELEKKLANR